jgi:hypothetical protein
VRLDTVRARPSLEDLETATSARTLGPLDFPGTGTLTPIDVCVPFHPFATNAIADWSAAFFAKRSRLMRPWSIDFDWKRVGPIASQAFMGCSCPDGVVEVRRACATSRTSRWLGRQRHRPES